jgi:D-methionine transport system ATP-binding protein
MIGGGSFVRADKADKPSMIRIEGLKKVFGAGPTAVMALDNVNLDIKRGDIHGIIGMSGAGKSTLIRLINRLDTPSEGKISIDGEDVLTMNARQLRLLRRRVSMIFQHFNLLMQKSVARNIRYPLEIAHVRRAQANRRVAELLEIVGLVDKADTYPAKLSGGQKQRVAIARALASDPEILLCDEATSALDPITTQSILALLQDINRRMGITIVVITHEMAVIRQICNKVTIIDHGEIVEEGLVDEVFAHTKSVAGRRLFGVLDGDGHETGREIGDAIRVVFDGTTLGEPMLSQFIIESGLPVNILSANIRRINEKPYGQILLQSPASYAEREQIIQGLRAKGLTVEEVHAL